jgi:hypothetical protein
VTEPNPPFFSLRQLLCLKVHEFTVKRCLEHIQALATNKA